MSRNLARSVRRASERKEIALTRYAFSRYGENVAMADLHPDVRQLFALAYQLHLARDSTDKEAILTTADAIANFIGRYSSQKKELTRPQQSETVESP